MWKVDQRSTRKMPHEDWKLIAAGYLNAGCVNDLPRLPLKVGKKFFQGAGRALSEF